MNMCYVPLTTWYGTWNLVTTMSSLCTALDLLQNGGITSGNDIFSLFSGLCMVMQSIWWWCLGSKVWMQIYNFQTNGLSNTEIQMEPTLHFESPSCLVWSSKRNPAGGRRSSGRQGTFRGILKEFVAWHAMRAWGGFLREYGNFQ